MGFSVTASLLLASASLLAVALNVWMWRRMRGGYFLPGCGGESGCNAVLSSRWSQWIGMSVTLPAATVDLALSISVVVAGFATSRELRVVAIGAVTALSVLVGAAAIWFVSLQILIIRRLCTYCLILHTIGIATCAFVLAMASVKTLAAPLAISGVGLTCLIAGQVLFRPRLYVITPTVASAEAGEIIAVSGTAAPTQSPRSQPEVPSRRATFMSGRISLAVDDWPVLGDPAAPCVIAYLFDYTCPTCRKGHRSIVEALRGCGQSTALIFVPAPVDPTCSPHVTRRHAAHAFACRFARLGLDLWRRRPESFPEYDRWIFEPVEPPAIGLARAFAEKLAGMTDMDPSIPDEDLDRLISQGVATYRASGADGMPTLLFRNAVLRGELPPAAELSRIIREQSDIARRP